jgi:hypothetical protein
MVTIQDDRMNSDIRQFEQHIYDVVCAIHKEYDNSFLTHDITYTMRVKRAYDDKGRYLSELEVEYKKAGDYLEWDEFFIYWRDEKNVDEQIMSDRIREDIKRMLSREHM